MFKSKLFLKIMSLIAIFIIAFVFVITLFVFPKVTSEIIALEEKNGKIILSKVVNLINNGLADLKQYEQTALNKNKEQLKFLTESIWTMVDQKYNKDPNSKQETIELINNIRYNKTNYFYVSDYKNTLLAHPYLKGKNLTNIKDIKGNSVLSTMVKKATKNGESYHKYYWKENKNDKNDFPRKKLTYTKNFPKWNIVIGTGIYIDDIKKEISKREDQLFFQLKEIIKTTKISKSGYLYVFNKKGEMLIHPDKKLVGKNIKTIKNPKTGTYIFKDLIKSAHNKQNNTYYYKWDKPNDQGNYKYEKISWTTHIPQIDWYISSSAYIEEFEKSSKELINYIIMLSTLLIIISLVIGYKYVRKIVQPISTLTDIADEVGHGNYDLKVNIKTDDEIGKLADNFNYMIETIKDHINNLDNKIEEKTKELNNERFFIKSIMNAQANIVVTRNEKSLETVNESFLKFFNVKTIQEYINNYGECISNMFDNNSNKDFIKKQMPNGQSWIEYILKNKQQPHKVIINHEQTYIFSITAEEFVFNGKKLSTITFSDITELERTKEEAEMILKSILLPVLITSKKTRKIVYANKYAQTQYESSIKDIIGSSIDDIYSVQGQQTHIINALQTKGYVDNFEETFVTKSGKKFTALLSVIPIIYHNEEAYIGMVTDISKQKEVEEKVRKINKNIQDSIEYASLIQGALIPDNKIFEKYFNDFFTIWEPKDIVGGDIYLVEELRDDNECLIMAIDCTGHGVPGAFVTMLVKAIERQIVAIINNNDFIQISPAWILSYFNRTIKTLLKQETRDAVSNAGLDGGVIYYNKEENILKFAGAHTPLFYIDKNKKLKTIKGDRHSVGYKSSDSNFEFTEHIIDIEPGMNFYLTSDGYLDQNGGEKDFPFGKKRFKNILETNQELSFEKQKEILIDELKKYQGKQERNDDISLIGFKL